MRTVNINRVVLTGNLTRDPELHVLPSGTSVCNLRVACVAHANPADRQEKVNYFDVKVYGAPAKIVERCVHKGRPVAVDGYLEWREWETLEGHTAQMVSIVADDLQFLNAA